MSSSLRPHGLQHAGLPYPSPSSGVCSNSCPLSQRCHPTMSSSFFCPQSFPASGSFPMSQLFASGRQSTGALPLTKMLFFPYFSSLIKFKKLFSNQDLTLQTQRANLYIQSFNAPDHWKRKWFLLVLLALVLWGKVLNKYRNPWE